MNNILSIPNAGERVRRLEETYAAYQKALQDTVTLQEEAIPALLAALNHKKAMPIAQALGHLMQLPAAEQAIARLLDFAFGQYPVFPDAAAAIARAGVSAFPQVMARLQQAIQEEDDEAVRNLLDIALRLPEAVHPELAGAIVPLLTHSNEHLREVAVSAFGCLGLPHGRVAAATIAELRDTDCVPGIREEASKALVRLRESGRSPSSETP